jgi:sugar phosphate isomerase/epimerase
MVDRNPAGTVAGKGRQPMTLGVFTRVFRRPDIESVARAIAAAGLGAVQLNLQSAVEEDLPESLDDEICRRIRDAFAHYEINISAVSGTFNSIHPDLDRRRELIRRVGVLASRCEALGTKTITLCTGTRDPESMWRFHPDNTLPEAWDDMLGTIRKLVRCAEEYDVILAFEPETANVVDSAEKAGRLISQIGSTCLRVVMDPANYFRPSTLDRMEDVMGRAFECLGRHICLAHAKDVRAPESAGSECVRPAAGKGVLDYSIYMNYLRKSGYDGDLLMHSLKEEEVSASKAHVERFL